MTDTKAKGGAYLLEQRDPETVFTPEDFTEEHKMIAKTTEDFVKDKVWPVLPEIENHQFEHTVRLLKEAGDLGLLGADVPEKYEGLGLDKVSSSLITEKISLARSFGLSHGAHVGIGSLPIVFFGNEEQKKKYLPDLASGRKLSAYALTEPSSGSDALGAKTTAKLSDDGKYYILNGEKQWITNSGFADVFIVYAKVDGDKFTAFIVERDFPGVSVGPEEKKMGIKGSSTRTLILEDAKVPVENLLGELGKGHKIAFNILNIGRYKLAIGTVGSSKRAIEISAQYANERKQFKVPISKFGLIREKLANMATKVYASESLAYRIAGMFDANLEGVENAEGSVVANAIGDLAIECSVSKVFGSEVLDYVVDEGVQIHGGYGFMNEYEIENMYRDSRINRIFEGTNEINRLIIPATLMRKALKGELPFLQAAQDLQEELLTMMPYFPDEDAPVLEAEEHYVENAKKIFLMVAGLATQKYGEKMQKEQELLRDLADIAIETFAMESALLRTKKAILKNGEENEQAKIDYTVAFIYDSMQKVDALARHALAAIEEGDVLRTQLSVLKKLTRIQPVNEVELKRRIAARIIDAEKYVV
ncbi:MULTISPECIES: acyl-CoA dehydrogenase family protein [Thermoactinomyces]|jgi:alkylation response protein AidB-like acyl-CoA dehydrogenase|uniref:Acyl-CoA dehydrogenase family protein n=1 Tax=Thermoactinomyces vulgaris TaxID=2026 RepID=A0ABS0QGG9_THEVU|nr:MULTISPECIES: acyl-CoA dehydrogenase family protein [Thermoactinomyces]KFZ41548.1 acyl-CoA dehydrogenase [Thermoactinomyces sp. Gus2-1]KYQ86379.1 acyl-CoA dehydrogenase [Thermoactinomyces sp. AS95]MBA4551865.1 acyl-CoA dehydrogenase family protein [Thermoactinomyces vulgaris]MBA4597196.1 acyl-CoA dehydrogenase family protein [Thermoactinomyces vulgaris]MBH8588338.1 acyl-CoA dehydrogenase family protein [Thermoactinomyces vulgaris]